MAVAYYLTFFNSSYSTGESNHSA